MGRHNAVVIEGGELIGATEPGYAWEDLVPSTELPEGWWVVMWPDSVATPKFNGDAKYGYAGSSLQKAVDAHPEILKYDLYGTSQTVSEHLGLDLDEDQQVALLKEMAKTLREELAAEDEDGG